MRALMLAQFLAAHFITAEDLRWLARQIVSHASTGAQPVASPPIAEAVNTLQQNSLLSLAGA
jgi:hypothetical protein